MFLWCLWLNAKPHAKSSWWDSPWPVLIALAAMLIWAWVKA